MLFGSWCLSFYYPTALPYGQAYMAGLGADSTKTIMASIRTDPIVPDLNSPPHILVPGEAGLAFSPRRGPLPSPYSPALPLGVGVLPLTRHHPPGGPTPSTTGPSP